MAADWAPPKTDKNGRELRGDYPVNGPARARAIAAAGKAKDPQGIVSEDQIKAAKSRSPEKGSKA